jgi:hypothetical protein
LRPDYFLRIFIFNAIFERKKIQNGGCAHVEGIIVSRLNRATGVRILGYGGGRDSTPTTTEGIGRRDNDGQDSTVGGGGGEACGEKVR